MDKVTGSMMSQRGYRQNFVVLLLMTTFVPSWSFKLGQQNTYTFTNEVNVTENNTNGSSYKLEGSFNVATIWRNGDERLVQFRLINSKLHTYNQKSLEYVEQKIDEISPQPFYATFDANNVNGIFLEPKECPKAANLKRALVSFFQYQSKDATVVEMDVAGRCDVSYIAWSPVTFTKTKLYCKLHDINAHRRLGHPLGVTETVSSRSNYELGSDGIVQSIESVETLAFKPNSYQNVEITVNSSFLVDLSPAVGTLETLKCSDMKDCLKGLKGVEESEINSSIKPKCDNGNCYNLPKQIREAKEFLADNYIGKSDSAATIVSLIQAGRQATAVEWERVLKARISKEIMFQLLDLMAAVQTKEAYLAIKGHLKLDKAEDFDHAERYLQSLSVGTQPDDYVIEDLLKVFKEAKFLPKLEDTFAQALASMARHLAHLIDDNYKDLIVDSVVAHLKEKLENCKDDDCKLIYLRSFGNLRAPHTIPKLLDYVHTGSNRVAVAAMKALKTFPLAFWNTHEMQDHLETVFYQVTYDSSARTLALDILLELKPSPASLTRLVNYLTVNDTAFEVRQYLIQKLQIKAVTCSFWRKALNEVLKDPQLNNYHVLGQKGLSTAILRQFAAYPSFNGSLLSVQEIKDGVLRRGTADIYVHTDNEKFSVFTLGLFTNGLSSFVGGTDDKDATPTAGMELVVQGTALRPLIFFNGQGELMGHVWSGTASEPTSAYQAVTLLQDHEEHIRLHNGAHVEFSALGAVSVDLNGQITTSLWNRNAVSKVVQNTGFATVLKAEVISFAHLGIEFEVTEEPSLHMHSNVDFSDKIALCIQLTQPQNELRHFVTKQIQIPKSTSFKSISTVARSFLIAGYTHALNKKNNDMCATILT